MVKELTTMATLAAIVWLCWTIYHDLGRRR